MKHASRDPDTLQEIEAVSRWMEHWLTPDEHVHVMTNTGYDSGGYFIEEHEDLAPRSPPPESSDDDVPS